MWNIKVMALKERCTESPTQLCLCPRNSQAKPTVAVSKTIHHRPIPMLLWNNDQSKAWRAVN